MRAARCREEGKARMGARAHLVCESIRGLPRARVTAGARRRKDMGPSQGGDVILMD